MNTRLKILRKTLQLTQQEFSYRLGTSIGNIASYETGRRNPSNAVVSLICREFNVSESWLRTGDGEMFVSRTRDEEIAEFIGNILRAEDDDFKKRLISQLATLDDRGWETLERFLDLVQHNKE